MAMRRLLPLVALVLAGGLVLGPSLAGAQSDGQETLVVIATPLRFEFVDLGRSGQSPGDIVLVKDALWDESQATRVGTNWLECTHDFRTVAICTAVSRIDGRGSLTGTGAVDITARRITFPVTGGTGDFQNVTGEVHATLGEETDRLEFHLSGVRP
jgi:hypothetical protein